MVQMGMIKTTMDLLYKPDSSITRLLVMLLVNLTQLDYGISSLLQVLSVSFYASVLCHHCLCSLLILYVRFLWRYHNLLCALRWQHHDIVYCAKYPISILGICLFVRLRMSRYKGCMLWSLWDPSVDPQVKLAVILLLSVWVCCSS